MCRSLLEALSRPSPVVRVLTGPRQVGKTTMALEIQRSIGIPALYASADSPLPPDVGWIESQWRRALAEGTAAGFPVLLILDEVQKVRGWSEEIKRLWDLRDRKREIRVLLLGSSALLMQTGLSESLAGRFFLHRCLHWGFPEVRDAFGWDLDRWLYFGGYPGAAFFAGQEGDWRRYVVDSLIETVLARDVLQLNRVAKPALLRHLFSLAATYPAQCVSYTKMLGQLQDAGNTTTLAHYLRLLTSAFLASGLDGFSAGHERKRASSPKLVLWNNALVSAMSSKTYADALADPVWWGRLVENAVGAHLLNSLPPLEYSVTTWRERNEEVDYVVVRGRQVWGLEVKSGRGGKAPGLARFQARFPRAHSLRVGGAGIPLVEFFARPAGDWLAEL